MKVWCINHSDQSFENLCLLFFSRRWCDISRIYRAHRGFGTSMRWSNWFFFLSCSLNEELISMWVSSCTSFRWCMIVDSSFVFITILFEDCTFSCHSVAISLRDSSFKVSCEQMMASIVSSGSLYKVARSLSFQNFVLSKLLIAFKITNCFS
jgi:hypothetical protein